MSSESQPLEAAARRRSSSPGASGYAGALAAQLVWNHPGLELTEVTARADAGTRLDELYPEHRVPMTLTELDIEGADDVDAAIVAYPHGASAPGRRRAARAGSDWSSTSPPTSGCATCRPTSAGTGRTARPSCSRAPSTACPS